MPYNRYISVSRERYEILMSNYEKYLVACSDPNQAPIKVFQPFTPKQLEDLDLIRELSKDLQVKKEEDMKKAMQQAAEAEEKAKEKAIEEAQEAEVPTETTPTEA